MNTGDYLDHNETYISGLSIANCYFVQRNFKRGNVPPSKLLKLPQHAFASRSVVQIYVVVELKFGWDSDSCHLWMSRQSPNVPSKCLDEQLMELELVSKILLERLTGLVNFWQFYFQIHFIARNFFLFENISQHIFLQNIEYDQTWSQFEVEKGGFFNKEIPSL